MFLVIDNYDSFTYNLVQVFQQQGRDVLVVKNDNPALVDLALSPDLSAVCLSPGPGRPERAGLCREFMLKLPLNIPVLGVCLGHQILGMLAGARVTVAERIMHGKQSYITHDGQGLFAGLPQNMAVGRYHSLLVQAQDSPDLLEVTARTEKDEVMALQYKDRPWVGIQFHPESVLTPEGPRLLGNFPQMLQGGSGSPIADLSTASPVADTPFQMSTVIEALAQGQDLPEEVAERVFSRLMNGDVTPTQAGAFLLGLRAKGETTVEVRAAVKAILERAVAVPAINGPAIDIVGTGGDRKFSFNCSTATALTLAGMGYKVLKHGNRSVSSKSGSADVLEQLGVSLDTEPEDIPRKLDEDNFVFLFASKYHPAFKHVMPIRRELGIRTLFNILGPLVNPARPTHHLLGVAQEDMLSLVADVLACEEGAIGAVVCGAGGYDELTPIGPASVIFVKNQKSVKSLLDPAAYGFSPCTEKDLAVEGPEHAAVVLRDVLQGRGPAPMRDMLALNLGLALYLLEDFSTADLEADYDHERMALCMKSAHQAVKNGAGRKFAYA